MPAMTKLRMTADEFVAWSEGRPDGSRYELDDGEVFERASERYLHAMVKGRVFRVLADAAGLSCDAFSDGMAVRVDHQTVYEPDAAARTGPPLDPDALLYDDPVVVVEVLSPSTKSLDAGQKLAGYFSLPSLRHYLIVRPKKPTVTHHVRLNDGTIQTSIVTNGQITLDPPGLTFEVASLFPVARVR